METKVSDFTYAMLVKNRPHGATHFEMSSPQRIGGYRRLNQEGCWDWQCFDSINEDNWLWLADNYCNTGKVDTSKFIRLF